MPVAADLYESLHDREPPLRRGPRRGARGTTSPRSSAAAAGGSLPSLHPRQRLFYDALSMPRGGIGPAKFSEDPTLSASARGRPLRRASRSAAGDAARGRREAGVPASGPLIIFGGIYDWNDPGLLLDAWTRVRAAVRRPAPLLENRIRRRHRRSCTDRPGRRPEGSILRRVDLFSAWLPTPSGQTSTRPRTFGLLSQPGLETDLAFRTRLLDAAWGGVPSVASGGGGLARDPRRQSVRRVSRNAGEVAEATWTCSSESEEGEAARRFAESRAWRTSRHLSSNGVARARRTGVEGDRTGGGGSLWMKLYGDAAGRFESGPELSYSLSRMSTPTLRSSWSTTGGSTICSSRSRVSTPASRSLDVETILVDNTGGRPLGEVFRRHRQSDASRRPATSASRGDVGWGRRRPLPPLLFVNDDAVLEPDALERLVSALRSAEEESRQSPEGCRDRAGRRNDFSGGFLTSTGTPSRADVGATSPLSRRGTRERFSSPAAGSWPSGATCSSPRAGSTTTTSRIWRTWTSDGGSGSRGAGSSRSRGHSRATGEARRRKPSEYSRAAFSMRRTPSRPPSRTSIGSTSLP